MMYFKEFHTNLSIFTLLVSVKFQRGVWFFLLLSNREFPFDRRKKGDIIIVVSPVFLIRPQQWKTYAIDYSCKIN